MYVCFNNPMSCFSASVRDLNALVCSPSVSPIVSPISINVVCRCMIFHVDEVTEFTKPKSILKHQS